MKEKRFASIGALTMAAIALGCGAGSPASSGPERSDASDSSTVRDASTAADSPAPGDARVPDTGKVTSPPFTTMTLSYIAATTITSSAFSYQMADFDVQRNQVLFYPYGSVTPPLGNSGVLLSY